MYKQCLVYWLVLCGTVVSAWGQKGGYPYPDFAFLRGDENYRGLDTVDQLPQGWHRIKWVPLGQNSGLSFGGEGRSELQILRQEAWIPDNHDAALFQRLMAHADLQLGQRFRTFVQLKAGKAFGRNGDPAPLDQGLDVHQAFMVWREAQWRIEIGRQELRYGSRRLIAVREGTNIRHSFDGGRFIVEKLKLRIDALFYAYNLQDPGVFTNRVTDEQLMWGAYAVWALKPQKINLDLYYLGLRNNAPRFAEGSERELRYSFGFRHWGNWGAIRYNTEGVLQFGSFGSSSIFGWTLSNESYWRPKTSWMPTLGLKAEIISGDRALNDGRLESFNPLYPRGGYFGLLALIGPVNLMDIHPSLEWSLSGGWSIALDWDFFWRHQLADGIYFPSGRLNLAGDTSTERFIGHQLGMQVAKPINAFWEVQLAAFYFAPGAFLKDVTPGEPFIQLGASVSYRF